MMGEKLNLGEVINMTFSAFLQNIGPFVGIALIVGLPSTLIQILASWGVETNSIGSFGPGFFAGVVATPLISMAETAIVSSAIIFGVVKYLNNEKFTFNECISTAISKIVPVILVTILSGIAVGFGFLLLIIPGIIFMLKFYVVVPTIVLEDTPIMDSFRRSSDLTDGNKWPIFALVLIVMMIGGALSAFVGGATAFTTTGFFIPELSGYLTNSVTSAFGATLIGVLYYNLRYLHDGIDASDLAAVFK